MTARTPPGATRSRSAGKAAAAGEIHRVRSRGVLVPLAERRLGLRLPQDTEITILQDPRSR